MIINLPLPDRNPGLYEAGRRCSGYSCVLSRNNPTGTCQPCQLTRIGREVDNVYAIHPQDAA